MEEQNIISDRIHISLTTIPERINLIKPTIDSLLKQDYHNYKICLWLPNKTLRDGTSFSELPDFVKHEKIEINFVEDLGSITKIYYELERHDGYVANADDDVIYPTKWLSTLWKYAKQYPDCAIAFRGRRFRDSGDLKYNNTRVLASHILKTVNEVHIVTGTWGALYHKGLFTDKFFTYKDYIKVYQKVDDIWITAMLNIAHTKILVVPMKEKILPTNVSKVNALWTSNRNGIANDIGLNQFKLKFKR